jgi:hypothetical protein
MKFIAFYGEGGEFGSGDLDSRRVDVFIQIGSNGQPGLSGRTAD